MFPRILNHPLLQITAFTVVIFSVLAVVFPNYFFYPFSSFSNYANQLMLLMLLGGLLCLLLRQPRLTFLCFAGSAILCIFLKSNNNSEGMNRWRQRLASSEMAKEVPIDPYHLSVVHVNLSNVSDIDSTIKVLKTCKAGLISLHELDPMWQQIIADQLSEDYPFQQYYVDIGLYGMGIISKYRMAGLDTLYFDGVPALRTAVSVDGQDLRLFSLHSEPQIHKLAHEKLLTQLDAVGMQIAQDSLPSLVFGEFNLVAWSTELQEFCRNAGLHESRNGFMQYVSRGVGSLLVTPFDHIFFTSPLQVVDFSNMMEPGSGKRLGIIGEYLIQNGITYVE